ncbi:MAG: isocitrate lyase/phosphoenolpyruvate mutase family protein, partial [Candidatus Eremiobacteraeota bacterium]|nr:isocitrate lyase/phosphoenolpyruvate mutase family protein [Candidatus Eremiobacteraeota bacterium]
MDLDEMIAAIGRITRTVRSLVTADVEAGYGADTTALARVMERVTDAGAVGVNVEDWDVRAGAPFPLDVAQGRIAAIKAHAGDSLFVNARSDLYLQDVGDPATRFAATVERLRAFVAAGADGVFVPGVSDAGTIGALVDAVEPAPLNVLAGPTTPPVSELAALGVGRVSVGAAPMRRILGETRAIARELREQGTFTFMRDRRAIPYAELNALFARH